MSETGVHPAARICDICWRVKPSEEWEHCFLCCGIGAYPDYDAVAAPFCDIPTRKCGECFGEGHKAPKETSDAR